MVDCPLYGQEKENHKDIVQTEEILGTETRFAKSAFEESCFKAEDGGKEARPEKCRR
jgi:hypothetical protein